MGKRWFRRRGAALIALTLAVRLIGWTGLGRLAGQALQKIAAGPAALSFFMWPGPGQAAPRPEEPEEEKPEPPTESVPEEPEEVPEPPAEETAPPLSFEGAELPPIKGSAEIPEDCLALLREPSPIRFPREGPQVLIVHTHTSEAYRSSPGWEYAESESFRTQDRARSVVRVGDELAAVLGARGICVLHDVSFNDYPSSNGAYARTLEKIEETLREYPSIQMVLDVHRDAA